MIDTFQRIAVRISALRYVAVALAAVCLVALVVIIFIAPASGAGNRYLAPAIVGFIWCLSAYGFIDTFQAVPQRVDREGGFFGRIKVRVQRAWFWLLASVFILSTLAAVFLTFKLGSFWLGRYHG